MKITFIGFGEVAGAFCGALASKGADIAAYDVLLTQPEGLERLRARAGTAAVSFQSLPEALYGANYVLSTVTTTVARAAAQQCALQLKPGQTYIDLNATEPEAKAEIAKTIEASGAKFVEGALLGAVGVTGAKTEILLGGPHARDAEKVLAGTLGLNARFYSEEIGRASMFKMLRSVFSKGMEALLIEFLVAAERAGIRGDLWSEVVNLFSTQPFEKVALNWVRSHSGAHARRRHEVEQVVGVLRSLGVKPTMTTAALGVFEQSARVDLKPLPTADDVIRFLEQKQGR